MIFLPNGNIYLAINSGAISEIVSTEWLDFSLVGSRTTARREPPAVKEVWAAVRVVKYCPNVTSCHLDTLTSLPNSKIHGSRVDFTDSPMCVVVHNQSSYSIEPYVPFRVIQSKWVFFTTPCFDRGG